MAEAMVGVELSNGDTELQTEALPKVDVGKPLDEKAVDEKTVKEPETEVSSEKDKQDEKNDEEQEKMETDEVADKDGKVKETEDGSAVEGVAESALADKETDKPQPKKRGRPRKDQTPVKPKETPSTPVDSEETPKPKRGRKKRVETDFSPPVERPSREKRSIDRYAAAVDTPRSREVNIKKGVGVAFRDIPNISRKLSKLSKFDAAVKSLHGILFGRAKDTNMIQNILQFSGFVWLDKDKEKSKVREKLEKFRKEELSGLIELLGLDLDIKGKKDELVVQVLDFLEVPHVANDDSAEEKDEAEKKRRSKSPGRTPGRPLKRQSSDEAPKRRGRKKKQSKVGDDDDDDDDEKDEDDDEEEDDEVLEEEEETEAKKTYKGSDEDDEEETSRDDAEVSSQERPAKKMKTTDGPPTNVFSRKDKKGRKPSSTSTLKPKPKPKPKSKSKGKNNGADEAQSAVNCPSTEQLSKHIRELLPTVDYKTTRYRDVIEHLGTKFNKDLLSEVSVKSRIKSLIKEEVERLVDEEEGRKAPDAQTAAPPPPPPPPPPEKAEEAENDVVVEEKKGEDEGGDDRRVSREVCTSKEGDRESRLIDEDEGKKKGEEASVLVEVAVSAT